MASFGPCPPLFSDWFTGAEQIEAPTLNIGCTHTVHAGVRTWSLMYTHDDNVHICRHAKKKTQTPQGCKAQPMDGFTNTEQKWSPEIDLTSYISPTVPAL